MYLDFMKDGDDEAVITIASEAIASYQQRRSTAAGRHFSPVTDIVLISGETVRVRGHVGPRIRHAQSPAS